MNKSGHARRGKRKQMWRWRSQCYDIYFLNICEKHTLVGENCIQSLKKKSSTNISPLFGCCRVVKYQMYNFTFHVSYQFVRYWTPAVIILSCSFRPAQMYLEYLDTDKMRCKVEKSIWNIWTRIKWEAKLKNLSEIFLFDFSRLCVFKCFLKLLAWVAAYWHWLHLLDFSPLCVFKCALKLPAWRDAKSH